MGLKGGSWANLVMNIGIGDTLKESFERIETVRGLYGAACENHRSTWRCIFMALLRD